MSILSKLHQHRCNVDLIVEGFSDMEASNTTSSVLTDVPCLFQEEKGKIQQGQIGAGLEYDGIVFFPPGTEIRPNSRSDERHVLTFTSPSWLNGAKLRVQGAHDVSGFQHHVTAFVKRVRT